MKLAAEMSVSGMTYIPSFTKIDHIYIYICVCVCVCVCVCALIRGDPDAHRCKERMVKS
jgi:hypothetical protein